MSKQNTTVVIDQGQQAPFGLVQVMILCGVFAVIIHYFWQIVAVAAIALTVFIFWLLFRDQKLRSQELLARADEQNRQYLAGDPRGIFGDISHDEGSQ